MPAIDQAKRAITEAISKRYYSCSDYDYTYNNCGYSAWDSYGRWILLAAIIIGTFFIFLVFSCLTARRRRRMGVRPFYGTGWAAHGSPQYTNQQAYYGPSQPSVPTNQYNQGWQAPPPQYGEAGGYYSGQPKPEGQPGQQNGIELQQPGQAHYGQPTRGGDNVYAAPAGPPPGK